MSESIPNRRSGRRLPARTSIKVTCRASALDLGPNLATAARDVTEHGAKLVLREEVAAGAVLCVTLEGTGNGFKVVRPAKVVWCQPLDGGGFEAGVSFEKAVPYADLSQLARV